MKKLTALLLVSLFALALLTGCGGGTTTDPAKESAAPSTDGTQSAVPATESAAPQASGKDTVYFISWMTSESFDPVRATSSEKTAMHAIFDTLVAFDKDGGIIPMLAESWEESADSMSITFKLREDVTFHDGTAFTADDVIYTFDAMLAQPTFYYLAEYIAGYEKIDDYTVRFDKAAGYTKLLEMLVEQSYIVPKDYHAANEDFTSAPIGTGPYKFVSQEADASVKLEAYEGYYGDAVGFKYAVIRPPLESANAVIALETGEADIASYIPASQNAIIEANDKLTLVMSDTWSNQTILLMGDFLASDNNLRKAIFHGINRENAILLGNEGIGTPGENMFALRIMGDYAGIIDFVGYDEAMAKDYLAKSNYNGEEILFTIYGGAPLATSIQADLAKIGINIKIEQIDMNGWNTKLMGGELMMTNGEFGTDTISTEDFLPYFASDNPYYGGYLEHNDEYDKLVADIKVTSDKAARTELVKQALQLSYDLANFIPTFDCTMSYAYGPSVVYDCPVSAPTCVYYIARAVPAA